MNPVILGHAPPKIPEAPRIKDSAEVEGSPSMLFKVQIYDEDMDMPLLIIAETHGQVCDSSINRLNNWFFFQRRSDLLLSKVHAVLCSQKTARSLCNFVQKKHERGQGGKLYSMFGCLFNRTMQLLMLWKMA